MLARGWACSSLPLFLSLCSINPLGSAGVVTISGADSQIEPPASWPPASLFKGLRFVLAHSLVHHWFQEF